MTEENIVKAQSVAIIGGEDGPTAIFAKGKKLFNLPQNLLKITKKRVVCAIALMLAVMLVADMVFAFVLTNSFLSKNGSKSFYKYAYGEKGLSVDEVQMEWLTEKSQSAFIEAENGKKLHALEIKNKNISDSYIIICHQYGESSLSMGEYAKHFYELGFNVLLPDLRGHGKTEVKSVSMGWEDRLDIVKWCQYITENDKSARIVLFGVSLGGSAVAMASGEELPKNVRVAIADSCYSSVWAFFGEYLKEMPVVPRFPVLNMSSLVCKSKTGWSFKEASTVLQAEKTVIPILYIHGENDKAVPVIQSNDIFEACSAKVCEQVLIQEGVHAGNLAIDETEYWSKIDLFILNNIGL